jgi:hypothetical protein
MCLYVHYLLYKCLQRSLSLTRTLSLSHTHAKVDNCKEILTKLLNKRKEDGDCHLDCNTNVDALWKQVAECLDDASMKNVTKMLTMRDARGCFTDSERIEAFVLGKIQLYKSTHTSRFVVTSDGGVPKPKRGNRFNEGVERVVYLHMFVRSKKEWDKILERGDIDPLVHLVIKTRLIHCESMSDDANIAISYVGQTIRSASERLWEHLAWWASLEGRRGTPSLIGLFCKELQGPPTRSVVLLRVKESKHDDMTVCNLLEALVADIAGTAINEGKWLNRSQCGGSFGRLNTTFATNVFLGGALKSACYSEKGARAIENGKMCVCVRVCVYVYACYV